jgi:hypothetical protein
MMDVPDFRVVATEKGEGIPYTCGCPCQPTAVPGPEPGFEHCCCGKVHFAGPGAEGALSAYIEERRRKRKREPEYECGAATVGAVEIAWAFPPE